MISRSPKLQQTFMLVRLKGRLVKGVHLERTRDDDSPFWRTDWEINHHRASRDVRMRKTSGGFTTRCFLNKKTHKDQHTLARAGLCGENAKGVRTRPIPDTTRNMILSEHSLCSDIRIGLEHKFRYEHVLEIGCWNMECVFMKTRFVLWIHSDSEHKSRCCLFWTNGCLKGDTTFSLEHKFRYFY